MKDLKDLEIYIRSIQARDGTIDDMLSALRMERRLQMEDMAELQCLVESLITIEEERYKVN